MLTFLTSWLVLLGRFSVLNFKHDNLVSNQTQLILPTPATSYVNSIGSAPFASSTAPVQRQLTQPRAAVSILWILPGAAAFAIVSGEDGGHGRDRVQPLTLSQAGSSTRRLNGLCGHSTPLLST